MACRGVIKLRQVCSAPCTVLLQQGKLLVTRSRLQQVSRECKAVMLVAQASTACMCRLQQVPSAAVTPGQDTAAQCSQ